VTSKSILAFVAALATVTAAVVHWRRSRSPAAGLFTAAAACFAVVAVAHLFETFSVLRAAGWGQPHSIGHYVDLSAAVLCAGFTLVGIVVMVRRRALI
jgi:hypothetical protein